MKIITKYDTTRGKYCSIAFKDSKSRIALYIVTNSTTGKYYSIAVN